MLDKQNIIYNWTFMRAVKLIMGLYVGFEAIANQQYALMVLAAFFLYQGIFNVGHCGINGCSVSPQTKQKTKF